MTYETQGGINTQEASSCRLQHTATHCNTLQYTGSLKLQVLFRNEVTNKRARGGGLGSSTIFKKFHEPYALSYMVLNDGA